jgi:penicillin-binding protein 1B
MPEIFPPDLDAAPPAENTPQRRESRLERLYRSLRASRAACIAAAAVLVAIGAGVMVIGWYYSKYARLIDAKLAEGPFSDTFNIFTAPEGIAVGDPSSPEEIATRLRHARYGTARDNPVGWYRLSSGAIEIFPGNGSFSETEPAVIKFAGGKIATIVSLDDNSKRTEYRLEPRLIANLSDKTREVRRLVRFREIPEVLVQAVLSAEDKHFFRHSGFDLPRIAKAAWVDVKEGSKQQGASTLTMQLARSLWLDLKKSWRRKAAELLITVHLESRLSKEEIFEYYANEIYLGRHGTFSIKGFGEGARVYFGKEIGRLTLEEAATLAGMAQRPGYFNPLRYPDRARERRNLVLWLMRQNRYVDDARYRAAIDTPLEAAWAPDPAPRVDAQYFVDLVNDELQNRFGDSGTRASHVYTTLDGALQRGALEAVGEGIEKVDRMLRAKKIELPPNQPQVALVALDPRTGEVKALVGGRDYNASQFDHSLARRQPGSIFKPFVFAAALGTAIRGGQEILTPATIVVDEPTTFQGFYEPGNFGDRFMGAVTLRRAMARSLNVAAVRVAEMVGYQEVVAVARRCGMPGNLRATPAVALGAYEATPLEIAAAYSVFANQGNYVPPALLSLVRDRGGDELYRHLPQPRRALDPRVAYLTASLLQEVLNSGTGAGVRARGFRLPAGGKTGTTRDGWFAGFTSELVCVVWVGFDDNSDLKLEGAKVALPIWTDFMKRAQRLRPYRTSRFAAPAGIVSAPVCEETGELASAYCRDVREEIFIEGSRPVVECAMHGQGRQFADRVMLGPVPSLDPAAVHTAAERQ